MLEGGADAVAMEVSSPRAGPGRVGGTRFAVGAFTNLSQDHLDFHADMESYFRAKALLFDGRAAAGVVDVDDEYGRAAGRRAPGRRDGLRPTGDDRRRPGDLRPDWSRGTSAAAGQQASGSPSTVRAAWT